MIGAHKLINLNRHLVHKMQIGPRISETKMTNVIKNFLHTEDGAAVVDMTMLMAALVGLALAVTASVSNGMEDLSGELETTMVDHDVSAAF